MLTPEAKRRLQAQRQRENRMISEANEYKSNLQKNKEREKLNNEIRKAEERYNALKKSYDNFVEYKRTYQYSKDPETRKREVKSNQQIEKEQELEVREARNYTDYLKGNINKIQEGYSANSLVDYASSKAMQDLNRWKSIYEGKKYTQKQIELGQKPLYNNSGKLVGYLDPKTYEEIKSTDYFKNRNITAENLKHYNQLIDYAKQKGLENLSPELINQLDKSYIKNNREVIQELRNQMPPGDKLLYDPKTYQIKGIESAMLKKSYSGIAGVEKYFEQIEKSPFLKMYINKLNYGQSVIPAPLAANKNIDLSIYNKGGILNQLKASISWNEDSLKSYNKAIQQRKTKANDLFSKIQNLRRIELKIGLKRSSSNQSFVRDLIKNPNFRNPEIAIQSTKNIIKLLMSSSLLIPIVFYDYGVSLTKGVIKVPLYALDNLGYLRAIRFDKSKGKFLIPQGTVAITDQFGKLKKWVNYDYKTNPLQDPDYQNVAIFTGLTLIGLNSLKTAKIIFGGIKGQAIWNAIQNPTEYNIAIVESMFLPGAIKKVRKALGRGDILVAKTGEQVPLKERIKQVDFVTKNSGKTVETITSKPSSKAKYTNVLSKTNPDYTYGNKIEFATYKVGKAYPTSEYFLKSKGTKLQQFLKTGRVNIEKVLIGNVNKKYGAYIKNKLLTNGKLPETFIKKYYAEAKLEANRLNKPIGVVSPKRLRGFWQAEQELVKILPDNYRPKPLKFAGFTKEGYRVFSDEGSIKSLGRFVRSKIARKDIEGSYWKEISGDKLSYLKGRKAMKGEYGEHGIDHSTAKNVDPYARNYAKNMKVKKFWNIFKQHDLAKVSDADSFVEFEHGKVLFDLWKKGKYPDKSIYQLPKTLQKQIAEAYAGHTPTKPRFLDSLKSGWKQNSVVKSLLWYLKNKRNPILQDTLTLDRIELPRAGRWNFRVKYNLLDKNSLKRIYGSELNAVKNIRFLDWKTVPGRLKSQLTKTQLKDINLRDSKILNILKKANSKTKGQNYGWTSSRSRVYKPTTTKKIPIKLNYKTRNYNQLKSSKAKEYYKKGFEDSYKNQYSKPVKYKTKLGTNQKYYNLGKKDYRSIYKPTPGSYKSTGGYRTPPPKSPPKYPPKYPPKSPPKYPPKYPPKSPPKYPPKRPPRTPPIMLPIIKKAEQKRLKKSVMGYYVLIKRNNRLIKTTPRPFELSGAKDYLAYLIDHSLSKTAFIVPDGKTKSIYVLPKTQQNYYQKVSHKLRPYRIRYGKKKQLINGFIEKRKYGLDTANEKRELRYSKRTSRPTRKTTKRKITPAQRRILLKRLKKARAVRMRNLRKK